VETINLQITKPENIIRMSVVQLKMGSEIQVGKGIKEEME